MKDYSQFHEDLHEMGKRLIETEEKYFQLKEAIDILMNCEGEEDLLPLNYDIIFRLNAFISVDLRYFHALFQDRILIKNGWSGYQDIKYKAREEEETNIIKRSDFIHYLEVMTSSLCKEGVKMKRAGLIKIGDMLSLFFEKYREVRDIFEKVHNFTEDLEGTELMNSFSLGLRSLAQMYHDFIIKLAGVEYIFPPMPEQIRQIYSSDDEFLRKQLLVGDDLCPINFIYCSLNAPYPFL